jgi:hypothetical protein
MLLIIALVALAALWYGTRAFGGSELIEHHTYNNHHSDAAAARDDHLG